MSEERIGLWAELSQNGAELVKNAILQKLCVVLCPLRDPEVLIGSWLKELGVKKLIYSDERPKLADSFNSYSLNDFLAESFDKNSQFSSIIRTSGTTGIAKNVLLKESAHLASARSVVQYFSLNQESLWPLSMPLYHVSGLSIIFRALEAGASILVAKDHEELKQSLDNKVTHLSLVPIQLKRLLDDGVALDKLQALVVGGDALPADLARRALLAGCPLFETYGLSETASMVWVKDARFNKGKLLPHAQMKIAKDGEILVGGQSLFAGYVEKDLIHSSKRFFSTGDVIEGEMYDLKIIGRKSNRIICGGENIQLEEIELAIKSYPGVEDCVVVGKPDSFGMRPKAFIKWEGEPLDEELYIYLLKCLASFKVPKNFDTWPNDIPIGIKSSRQRFLS